MGIFTRRELLHYVRAIGAAATARLPLQAAPETFRPAPMKITDVEVHEIVPPYQDYNASHLFRYQALGFQTRAVFIVRTDVGLEGYGETGGGPAPSRDKFAYLIGRSPFREFTRADHLGISMALYDLMGKYLGVPLWQLIGPQVRTWVPLSGWTMSQSPRAMAEEARQLSRRGYHWMKYHVDVFQNVVDQTEAVQRVAPPSFRLHYDFNGDENLATVLPILKDLEKFPVAGRVEDPIRGRETRDREDWLLLRRETSLPILAHGPGTDYLTEKAADGCIASRAAVPEASRVAHLAEAANAPFMLQHVGGNLTLAFLAHEASVFRMATLAHVNCCHIWKDDVTVEHLPLVDGSVQVPEGPGLGVTIDREKLRKYVEAPRLKRDRFLARMSYRSGLTVYLRFADHPYQLSAGGYPLDEIAARLPGTGPTYRKPVVTDFWDQTGSPEFERIWKLTEKGPYWMQPNAPANP
ncbi:MAG: mandelate racemase/muconate lactonizing enzyme family protein [Bryobacteraceae bacterium]